MREKGSGAFFTAISKKKAPDPFSLQRDVAVLFGWRLFTLGAQGGQGLDEPPPRGSRRNDFIHKPPRRGDQRIGELLAEFLHPLRPLGGGIRRRLEIFPVED